MVEIGALIGDRGITVDGCGLGVGVTVEDRRRSLPRSGEGERSRRGRSGALGGGDCGGSGNGGMFAQSPGMPARGGGPLLTGTDSDRIRGSRCLTIVLVTPFGAGGGDGGLPLLLVIGVVAESELSSKVVSLRTGSRSRNGIGVACGGACGG